MLETRVPVWHGRSAFAQVVMVLFTFTSALIADDSGSWALGYTAASLAITGLAWAVLRQRTRVRLLLLWPFLNLVLLAAASVVVPEGAEPAWIFIVASFLFAGVTQPSGTSLVLLGPSALVAWWLLDLPAPDASIRIAMGACVWVAVAELPARLAADLRTARFERAHEAATDALTGLANRREWSRRLEELREDARRERTALAVLLVDLDHFKAYNDTRGHVEGDELLRVFARCIDAVAPDPALVARWGGEEFAVALAGVNEAEATAVAERIRGVVPDHQSCSIGLTLMRPSDTEMSVVARADAALYQAKEDGRDRVRVML